MSKPSILVVEDEANLRTALRDNLVDEGYAVRLAADAKEARRELATPVDLVVLDIMLPDASGYDIAREIRAAKNPAMILMLTARTLEEDIVKGFDAGADDYVAKPYRLAELLARVKALVRRGQSLKGAPAASTAVTSFAGFELDKSARTLSAADGSLVELTKTEFDLLAYFLEHRDRALSRQEILDSVWGADVVVDGRTIDNFVSNLKKKLSWTPAAGFHIRTLRGIGYRFELD